MTDGTPAEIHAAALRNIEALIAQAKLGVSHRDWHTYAKNEWHGQQKETALQVHRFYTAMQYGEDLYGVKMTVREKRDGRSVFYTLETHSLDIQKISPEAEGNRGGVANAAFPVQSPAIKYKSFFEKFKPVDDLLGLKYKDQYPFVRFSAEPASYNGSEVDALTYAQLYSKDIMSLRKNADPDATVRACDAVNSELQNSGSNLMVSAVAKFPPEVLQQIKDAGRTPGEVKAFWSRDRQSGAEVVWVNANIVRPCDILPIVMQHEIGIHAGIRRLLSPEERNTLLAGIAKTFPEEFKAFAEQYGYPTGIPEQTMLAAEEFLAKAAEFQGHLPSDLYERYRDDIVPFAAGRGLERLLSTEAGRERVTREFINEELGGKLDPAPWYEKLWNWIVEQLRKIPLFRDHLKMTAREIRDLAEKGIQAVRKGERIREGWGNETLFEADGKYFKKWQDVLQKFKDDLKNVSMTPEQQEIYNAVITPKSSARIRINDLNELEDVFLHYGTRKKGAHKIISIHYAGLRNNVTALEVLQIGDVIRRGNLTQKGTDDHPTSRCYTLKVDDGATLKVVIDYWFKKDKNRSVINFYSDREPGAHNVSSRRDTDLSVNIADSEEKSSVGIVKNDKFDEGMGAVEPVEEDSAFARAEQDGDIEAGKQMVADAAAKAMPNTKVVGPDGKPMVVDGLYLNLDKNPVDTNVFSWAEKLVDKIHEAEEKTNTKYPSREFFYAIDDKLSSEIFSLDGQDVVVLDAFFNGKKPVYRVAFRYGDVPKNGRSVNFRDNYSENGVSVVGRVVDLNTKKTSYDLFYKGEDYSVVGGWDFGNSGADGEMLLSYAKRLGSAENVGKIAKSADPFTYDDNGNLIPLSERFNDKKNDIRFAGEMLSPEEMEICINAVKEYADAHYDELSNADMLQWFRDNGIDLVSDEATAHAVFTLAQDRAYKERKAATAELRSKARAAREEQAMEWFSDSYDIFREVRNSLGGNMVIKPTLAYKGEEFTGDFISPEWVKITKDAVKRAKSGKVKKEKEGLSAVKSNQKQEELLQNASGMSVDTLAAEIAGFGVIFGDRRSVRGGRRPPAEGRQPCCPHVYPF